jgi:hypothetical protein
MVLLVFVRIEGGEPMFQTPLQFAGGFLTVSGFFSNVRSSFHFYISNMVMIHIKRAKENSDGWMDESE